MRAEPWAPPGREMGIDRSEGTERFVLPLHIHPRHCQGAL